MAKEKIGPKKTIRLQIVKRLEETFSDLQEKLGNQKFKRNIKKASKALAADLKEMKQKVEKQKKLPAKKKQVKKAEVKQPS